MLCTTIILQIASYMKNPIPVLCCAKWLYKHKTNSMYFPLPCPLPPSCPSNYDFYKRKTLLQDVCFYCGDDLGGGSSCLLLCTCIGFYPKLHYECVGVTIKYKVGYAVCPLCKTNCMYYRWLTRRKWFQPRHYTILRHPTWQKKMVNHEFK